MAYIAFRGTDGTLTGWKEDFNLSYKPVIPSQRSALAYVSGVSSGTQCPLILGGHSKGGNLAQYAALCTDEGTYRRIIAIYDHDFLKTPPLVARPQISIANCTSLSPSLPHSE